MKRTIPFLLAAAACGPSASTNGTRPGSVDPVLLNPASPAPDRAKSAALSAAVTANLAADISAMVTQGFNFDAHLSASGGLMIPGTPFNFQASGMCSHHVAFGGQHVSLEENCSTPQGRSVRGTLEVAFSQGCAPFGISVEYHLQIESDPGAGDQLLVDGAVNLGLGHRALNLQTSLDLRAHDGGHDFAQSVGACIILDGHNRLFAMNGHVTTSVDNATKLDVKVDDLQLQLCEVLPYNGSVQVMDPHDNIKVTFDQATPEERKVTVVVNDDTFVAQLPDEKPVRWCSDRVAAPTPMMIDYASCGGCSQPPAPTMQPAPTSQGGGSSGSSNSNNGGGGSGPVGPGGV